MRRWTLVILSTVCALSSALSTAWAQPQPQETPPETPPAETTPTETSTGNRPVLTLSEARELLPEGNLDLAQTRYGVEQARLLEDRAMAVLLPSVTLTGVYTLRDQEVTFTQPNAYAPLIPYLDSVYNNDPDLQQFFTDNPTVPDARLLAQAEFPPAVIQNQHDVRGILTVTQTIFNARAFPLLDQAEIALAQAENGVEQAKFALEGGLLQIYFTAVSFQRVIQAAEHNVELAQINLDRTRAALEEDVGSQFEVTRAEVGLSRAQRDLENARLAYTLGIDALATYLQVEGDFDVESPPELANPPALETLVGQAVDNRQELQGIDLSLQQDQARIEEVDSQWYPIVIAQGTAMVQPATAFGGDEFSWSVQVSAIWDIWDGGMRGAESDSRELTLSQDEARLHQALVQIETELRQALVRLQTLERNVESARSEAALSTENLELTREALLLGAANQIDVELAQQQLFFSELAIAEAEVQYQQQIYEIYRLAGTLE